MFEVFTTVSMSTCLCYVTLCSLLVSFPSKLSKQRVVLLEGLRVAGSAQTATRIHGATCYSLQHVAEPTFEPETSRI